MDIYERNINCAVQQLSDERIGTKASLLDLNHNMRVDLIVNVKTREIERARVQMTKTPFAVCHQTEKLVEAVQGLRIERGISARLYQLLGRGRGCTHLFELALEAVRLSSNVMLGLNVDREEWVQRRLDDAEFVRRALPFLRGSCLPFTIEEGGLEEKGPAGGDAGGGSRA
jgi:hypothetical protein